GDAWMVVAQQQRAVAAAVIDILAAVDVPFARAGGALDVDAVRVLVTGVVRDAAGENAARLLGQLGGARREAAELVDDGGTRPGHGDVPLRRVASSDAPFVEAKL